MLRQENLWIWISALVAAGVGWNMNLAIFAIEMDMGGAGTWVFGSDVAAKAAASITRPLVEACGCGAAVLLAAGLLAEASNSCPKARPVKVRV
jgi:hypothetical protein